VRSPPRLLSLVFCKLAGNAALFERGKVMGALPAFFLIFAGVAVAARKQTERSSIVQIALLFTP
jgi:hypothetical protein